MSGAQAFEVSNDVSRETLGRLGLYAGLLKKWNKSINLVGRSTLPNLWARHFQDSAQIFELFPPSTTSYADLGSGAGLPGLVIATLAKQSGAEFRTTCVESDQRKAVFLRTVIRELQLNATVVAQRIETAAPLSAEVLSARALAPLSKLLPFAKRHLTPDGKAIFLKGSGYLREIEQVQREWSFDIQTIPSKTDPDGAVLILGGIRRE